MTNDSMTNHLLNFVKKYTKERGAGHN